MKKRNKIFTKLLCIALVCVMLVTSMGAYSGESTKVVNTNATIGLSGSHNDEFVNALHSDRPIAYSDTSLENEFEIFLSLNDDATYSARGTISRKGEQQSFVAEGALMEVNLPTGSVGLIGNLLGEIDLGNSSQENEHINITIHSIPSENKLFAFITGGMFTETTDIETLAYGESFEGMTELVELYTQQNTEISSKDNQEDEIQPFTATDEDIKFHNINYMSRTLKNGQKIPLAAVSIYAPEAIRQGLVYEGTVKVNGNEANAKIFTKDYYSLTNELTHVYSNRGKAEFGASNKNMTFSNLNPSTESRDITVPIPYLWGGILKFFNLNFDYAPIKASLSRNNSTRYNVANWSHNYAYDMSWGDAWESYNNAKSSKVGYMGRVEMSHLHSSSQLGSSVSIYGTGSITYSFVYTTGNVEHFTGSYTIECPKAMGKMLVKD